jgi:large subunit ribosomal protein L35
MPKMKTHSGAKKRFKLTATGKVRGRHAFTSHILEKKSAKRKRTLGAPALLSEDDTPRIKRMLGAPTKSTRSASKASGGAAATSREAKAAPRGSKAPAKKGAGS